ERCERSAGWNALVVAIKVGFGLQGRRTRRHDGAHAAGRLADEPKAVTAEVVHMRIDGGDRRGHGEHGFERIAAFGEDRPAGLYSCEMRRADDPTPVPGAMQVHG